MVTIRRGDHAPYSYDYTADPVKPGKAERVVFEALYDLGEVNTRGWKHTCDIRHFGLGGTFRTGSIRGSVRARKSLTDGA